MVPPGSDISTLPVNVPLVLFSPAVPHSEVLFDSLISEAIFVTLLFTTMVLVVLFSYSISVALPSIWPLATSILHLTPKTDAEIVIGIFKMLTKPRM